jgi:two-component system, chemotaxis family, chemotaxis protein CheY
MDNRLRPLEEFRMTQPQRGAILVVEDRDDVRQGLAQLLELHGFLVAEARDGHAALAALEGDSGIVLILLDLMLPGTLSGTDLRMKQLAEPRLASIPTIIVTAADLGPSEHDSLRPSGWLEKPFRFDDLLELVKQYVSPEIAST